MCMKSLETGWITVARCLYGTVWLENFCPNCHEAAEASYQKNLKDQEQGFDKLPEEMIPVDSTLGSGDQMSAPRDYDHHITVHSEMAQGDHDSTPQTTESSALSPEEMRAKFKAMFAEAARGSLVEQSQRESSPEQPAVDGKPE